MYLQVCGAGNLMERVGHRAFSLWCVFAGPELSGRHLSAPLLAVWLSDRRRRPGGRALCLPGDACERTAAYLGVWRVAAQRWCHSGPYATMLCNNCFIFYVS